MRRLLASEMENGHVRALSHFDLANLPVHSFCCAPRKLHLFRNLLPHILLEPTFREISVERTKEESEGRVVPLIQPRELVLLLLIPFRTPFEVVLESQATADCTSSW